MSRYSLNDIVTLRVGVRGVFGLCRIVEIGPAPAPGKLGSDWANDSYTVQSCRDGVIVRGLLDTEIKATGTRPRLNKVEDFEGV